MTGGYRVESGRWDSTTSTRRRLSCAQQFSERSYANMSVRRSFELFDLRHRELAVDPLRHKFDLVARFHELQHRGVGRPDHHRHAVVHVELLQRAMADRDLAG